MDSSRPKEIVYRITPAGPAMLSGDEASDDVNFFPRDALKEVEAVEAQGRELLQDALMNSAFPGEWLPVVIQDSTNYIQLDGILVPEELNRVSQHVVHLGFDRGVAVGVQETCAAKCPEGSKNLAGVESRA
jgi:hypothetical protein